MEFEADAQDHWTKVGNYDTTQVHHHQNERAPQPPLHELGAELLSAPGIGKRYLIVSPNCDAHADALLPKLFESGRVYVCSRTRSDVDESHSEKFGGSCPSDPRVCVLSPDRFQARIACDLGPFAAVLLDFGAPQEFSGETFSVRFPRHELDGQQIPRWLTWVRTVEESELARVLERYGPCPGDALLAARAANEIISICAGDGDNKVLQALGRRCCNKESTVLPLASAVSAIHCFLNKEAHFFQSVMQLASQRLLPGGRLVVVVRQHWQQTALRHCVSENCEPGSKIASLLSPEQLKKYYTLTAGVASHCLRRVGPVRWPTSSERSESTASDFWSMHVFERVARRSDIVQPTAEHGEVVDCSFDSGSRPPSLPEFRGATPAERIDEPNCGISKGTRTLQPTDTERFAELRGLLAARKAELAKLGLSVREQRRDERASELARLSQEIFRCTERSAEKARVKCRDRGHVSVLLKEAVTHVTTLGRDGGYVDCTFGRGGHTKRLLEQLSENGRVWAFDIDSTAVEVGKSIAAVDSRFTMIHAAFGDISSKIDKSLNGVLLDLGVSSPQLDEARRGFSFKQKKDGPLDLRMNQEVGQPASQWLQTVSASELAWVLGGGAGYRLHDFIPHVLAEAILEQQRRQGPFETTRQLAVFLEDLGDDLTDECPNLPLPQIVFTSIRMFLNQEAEQLRAVLEGSLKRLQAYGRIAVITFNRWEVIAIRDFLRRHEMPPAGFEMPSVNPGRQAELYPLLANISARWAVRRVLMPIRPTAEELARNPRARSATLHVLEKVPRSR